MNGKKGKMDHCVAMEQKSIESHTCMNFDFELEL